MSFADQYKQKLTTAEQAVRCVKSGDWVDYGWCVCHPVSLDRALAARAEELTDINIRGGIALWKPAIAEVPDMYISCSFTCTCKTRLCTEKRNVPY